MFDYELEVAAVVGTAGSDLDPADAASHIAGYTILCDWSARDLQKAEMKLGLGPAKGKDSATSLGPYLVTPDELGALDLGMQASVNGVPYSAGRLDDLYWSFGQLLAYASRGTRLVPGEVIGSGTVGTGCILELSRVHGAERYPYLAPGDVVRCEVDGLPSLGLSPQMVARIMDALAQLRDEGLTIVLVEQNARAALALADRAQLLQAGRIVLSGTAAELAADPTVAQVYLGGAATPAP